MIKKLFSFMLLAFIFLNIANVSAQYTTDTSGWYNDPIQDDSLNFDADLEDGDVYMKWSAFRSDEKMKYYKVIRSATVENPVYPDNGYIKVITNINTTKFVDYKPLQWTAYYRVCAITDENNRYCSNVVKIYNDKEDDDRPTICTADYSPVCGYKDGKLKTYSNKCNLTASKAYYKYSGECKDDTTTVCTDDYTPVCWLKNGRLTTYSNKCNLLADKAYYKYSGKCEQYSDTWVISDYDIPHSLKVRALNMINWFIAKLEKAWYSNEKKIEVIDNIIEKLNNLEEEKPSLSNIINYLITLLKEKKLKYENDFWVIEDIFDID